jgi:hypothetical protein
LTAVAVAGAAYVTVDRERATNEPAVAETLFPGLGERINDVAVLTVKRGADAWTIRRGEDGGWTMSEKHGYPVSADRVKKAVVALSDLRVLEPKTAKPELYAKIGVQAIDAEGSEAVRIGLQDGGEQELAALLVGKTRKAESGAAPAEVYVREPDAARAWLVEGHLDVKDDPLTWLDPRMLKVERKRVNRVVTTHPDGERIEVEQSADSPETFKLLNVPEGRKAKSSYTIDAVAGGLAALAFQDVALADDIDFREGATVSRIETSDGLRVTTRVVEREDARWLSVEAAFDKALAAADADTTEVEKEVAEINARAAGWAYKISTYDAENLTRRMADLTEKAEGEASGSDNDS